MERIKLAIEKARETAAQAREETTATGQASPMPAAAARQGKAHASRLHAQPQSRSWMPATLLLLGLAAVGGIWALMGSEGGASSRPAPVQTVVTPQAEQPVAMVTPTPPAEPTPASVAPEPAKPPVPVDEQVKAAVEAWRQAWSTRDMMTYLDAYGEAFTPPDGVTRSEWIASRYRNVGGRSSIDVQIKELQVMPLEQDRARVSFLQDYRSGSYRETAQPKTLDLVRDADDRWRITGEWQGQPPPLR